MSEPFIPIIAFLNTELKSPWLDRLNGTSSPRCAKTRRMTEMREMV
jgi:hypothetical protein